MDINRIKQILGSETSKEATNRDAFIKINVNNNERLLPPGEILRIVNVDERFTFERQQSTFYRIIGTINLTATNALFNLNDSLESDNFTWSTFNYFNTQNGLYRFFEPVYLTAINNNLVETNGWFGYYDPDISKAGLCDYYDMEPKRNRFYFLSDTNPYHAAPNTPPVKNWELTITYPYAVDSGHTMVQNGLFIVDSEPAVVSTRVMTAFAMPCIHNLQIGDIVRISGTTGYDGDHLVVRTGQDNGELKEYYFVIDVPPIGQIGPFSRIKRVVNNFESQYYFRRFKKIKTRNSPIIENNDYETYRLAFSENIYADTNVQFSFNEDIDISDLKDNLGRPLTEIYFTVIKTNSNELFSKISSGIEVPFISKFNTSPINTYLQDIPVINKIHNGNGNPWPSHIPLEPNVTINSLTNDFYGDLVEYNTYEVKETVLAEIAHRFNTKNRETASATTTYNVSEPNIDTNTSGTTNTTNLGPRQEGYFYKPHHRMTIKTLSSYVEQGDENTVGIPDYATNLNDGRYFWRDILNVGVNETDELPLNYPFLNGCHYLYNNYCFYVKRQDPFDNWDLYYAKFPSDPIGERITDKFNINSAEDVC